MNNVRFPLIAMLALIAIVAAGCAGTGVDNADDLDAGTTPSILAPGSGLAPNDGSAETDEATDEDVGGDQATDLPDDADVDAANSDINCAFDNDVQAVVGEEYSQQLSATGGSGEFGFEATGLPAGLSLSRSGIISGTPQTAGEQEAKIVVTDLQGGNDRHCSIDFEVRETIAVSASIARGATQTVWTLKVNGTAESNLYGWSFSQELKLCGSTSAAAVSGEDCPDVPSFGKVIYVWTNQQVSAETEVTATAFSPYAESASAPILFPNNLPKPVTYPAQLVTTNPVQTLEVESITVKTMTGVFEHPGTDCDITITFCTDASMTDCVSAQELDNADVDDFEGGNIDAFHLSNPPSGMTSAHRYFKIKQTSSNCGDHPGWHLRGVDVRVNYDDDSYYLYYNPCIAKWMNKGDTIKFGPNDTAVCVKMTTGDVDKAGTDDEVNLQIKTRFDVDLDDLEIESEELSTGAPHFSVDWAEDHNISNHLPLMLEWADYNDFERTDEDWYGDYIFDSNPFPESPSARIKKAADGDNGGWYLEEYEVYLFQPARLSEAGTVFHAECDWDNWIQDASDATEAEAGGLMTDGCELDLADAEEIDNNVGKN